MLGSVDSFSDRQLAFLRRQTVPHYWLTSYHMRMRFLDKLIKDGKRKLA